MITDLQRTLLIGLPASAVSLSETNTYGPILRIPDGHQLPSISSRGVLQLVAESSSIDNFHF